LFRARDIVRKRPKLAKRAKSKNMFLKHLTYVLSMLNQMKTQFVSNVVVIKNNQFELTEETENEENDNLLELDAALMLSSFENALVYSKEKQPSVQPQSMRNYRKFQMGIVPALRSLYTHFSDLIRVIIRKNRLMCVNINEVLLKRDIILNIPDLINSLETGTENEYGMQKVPFAPVTLETAALFDTDDEYTDDDEFSSDNALANSCDNGTGNTDITPATQNIDTTEAQIKIQEPTVHEYQEIPLVIKLDVPSSENVEVTQHRVWPLVDLTNDTTSSIETNKRISLEFPVETSAYNNQAEQNCDANDSAEIAYQSNSKEKESINENSSRNETVQSNTVHQGDNSNSTESTSNPGWQNLGQNRTRKFLQQERLSSIVSKRTNESSFFSSERAISERTTLINTLPVPVPQDVVFSASTSHLPTIRVKTDLFIERDPSRRIMSNNIFIDQWDSEDDDDYNSTNF
jgi:hypothetical protein